MATHRDDRQRPDRYLWILSVDPGRPINGQLAYTLGLVRALAGRGTELTVLHPGMQSPTGFGDRVAWKATGSGARSRLPSMGSMLPAMAYTAATPAFRRLVDTELDGTWDAVVIDHVGSGWAMKSILGRRVNAGVVVHCSHNDEEEVRARAAAGISSNPVSRAVLAWDAYKVARLQRRVVKGSDVVTTITDEDSASLSRRHPGLRAVVLPPGYDGARVARRTITEATPRRAVIAGSLDWRVKQHDLLELLRIADPAFAAVGAEIVVVGEAPDDFVERVHASTTATTLTGRVDRLATPFADARLALVSEPHGGGFKLKSLDYAFHRVPMLVQTGSVSGLPFRPGTGMLEFRDVESLVDGAVRMLDDVESLDRLQREAFDECASAFDWADRADTFRTAVRKAAGVFGGAS